MKKTYTKTIYTALGALLFLLFNLSFTFSPHANYEGEINTILDYVSKNRYQIKTIVLDPGHGGKDWGCKGKHSKEKHIALGVANKLGKMLNRNYPEIEVIYTRKGDYFVSLHKRASIANDAQADLFISIHCNYIRAASHIRGSETYVMGLHTAEENLEVAKRENEAILLEDNYQDYYDYDPNSPEGHIMLSMFQHAFLTQSIAFAEKVEQQIGASSLKSRGVRQAGFVVLRATTMPSVLIETGYLSNNNDETFLNSEKGQESIANSIFDAFALYRLEQEALQKQAVITDTKQPISYASAPKQITTTTTSQPLKFRIQVAAAPKPFDEQKMPWRDLVYPVKMHQEDKLYKYQIHNMRSYQHALSTVQQLKKLGMEDAFIVAYRGQSRVPMSEAMKIATTK